jgi:hypothetical protein
VFAGLSTLRAQQLNVAFVDFAPLWDGVLGSTPGFAAFGYKNPGNCIPNAKQTDLSGECATPLNSFYWLPSCAFLYFSSIYSIADVVCWEQTPVQGDASDYGRLCQFGIGELQSMIHGSSELGMGNSDSSVHLPSVSTTLTKNLLLKYHEI